MPYYKTQLADGPVRLVEASSAAAAKAHVLRPLVVTCEIANTGEVVKLMSDGVKVETAGEEPAPPPPADKFTPEQIAAAKAADAAPLAINKIGKAKDGANG